MPKKKGSSESESSSVSESSSISDESLSSDSSSESSASSSSSERQSKKKSSSKKSSKKSTKNSKSKKGSKKVTKKKGKAKKDPNAPKRALSSYFFYTAKRREELKAEGSKLKPTELTKQFGAEWKEMTDEQKAPFIALNEKDKARYLKEKANYKPAKRSASSSESDSDSDKPKKKKSKKAEKDPNAPKKAMNAYMFFANANREKVKAENPGLKATEVVSELGAQWKTLSDADKKPYNKMAADDKVRYSEAMETYSANK